MEVFLLRPLPGHHSLSFSFCQSETNSGLYIISYVSSHSQSMHYCKSFISIYCRKIVICCNTTCATGQGIWRVKKNIYKAKEGSCNWNGHCFLSWSWSRYLLWQPFGGKKWGLRDWRVWLQAISNGIFLHFNLDLIGSWFLLFLYPGYVLIILLNIRADEFLSYKSFSLGTAWLVYLVTYWCILAYITNRG